MKQEDETEQVAKKRDVAKMEQMYKTEHVRKQDRWTKQVLCPKTTSKCKSGTTCAPISDHFRPLQTLLKIIDPLIDTPKTSAYIQ